MTKTIFGVFNDKEDASEAISKLREKGYNPKDISILMKDQKESILIAQDTGIDVVEGAAAGATTGALIGGLAGLVASFAIPGLGAFFIGGPLAAALGLTGVAASTVSGAATGALAGGVLGILSEYGLSDEDAKIYEKSINEGGILLAVPVVSGKENQVEEILTDFGAENIKSISLDTATQRRNARTHSNAFSMAKGGRVSRRNVNEVSDDIDDDGVI